MSDCRICARLDIGMTFGEIYEEMKRDAKEDHEFSIRESKSSLRSAKQRGQTFNQMIRQYNAKLDTLQDRTPTDLDEYVEDWHTEINIDIAYLFGGPMTEEHFDLETERLLKGVLVDVDPDQLSTEEPLY
ncbi:MAG: hypothetical protein ACXAEN_25595 [Candidatus Thorarchaeota archaeon]|jgi:hypothetical protein